MIRAGKIEEARREYSKAVDITHEHAVQLMKECQQIGVDCIVGMYEADSQLAYLNKIGIADYIISEDSDLILFGAKKILFKLQIDGRCQLFESSKLHLTLGIDEEKFDFEKFRRICILSGCDYLDSLPGIGLGKAKKFMMMTEEDDMRRALMKIPSYLNMRKLTVTEDYIEGFLRAEATFKFMYVFDPVKREMLRLNELDETDEKLCCNAGELMDQSIAYQIALGNMNPRTLTICHDFNPDVITPKLKIPPRCIWRNSNQISHDKSKVSNKQIRLSSFFSSNKKYEQVQDIAQKENEVTTSVEVSELVSNYCNNSFTATTSTSKRRSYEHDEKDEIVQKFNPFAKRQKENFNSTNQKVTSKYFTAKTETVTKIETYEMTKSDKEESMKVEKLREEQEKASNGYYERLKIFIHNSKKEKSLTPDNGLNSQENVISSQEIEEESIDVDSYEFTSKPLKLQSQSQIKPAKMLTKKKSSQKIVQNNSQTLLSRFGFEKRTTANS